MHTLRTRFGKDIVAEFLPPSRITKKQRVIIICSGAPSVPSKKSLLEFLSKKGFWAIHFRYRGSWESGGTFLKDSPHKDVIDLINQLPKGFKDLWNEKQYRLKPDQIIILASSFGGPAGIIASLNNRVDKVVAISPMIDWRKPGPDEPLSKMSSFFNQAFGQGYRVAKNGWQKLQKGQFYNPINHTAKLDGRKLLIIHAKDDRVCPYALSKHFAAQTGAEFLTLPRGGHLSADIITLPRFYKTFKKFIND